MLFLEHYGVKYEMIESDAGKGIAPTSSYFRRAGSPKTGRAAAATRIFRVTRSRRRRGRDVGSRGGAAAAT